MVEQRKIKGSKLQTKKISVTFDFYSAHCPLTISAHILSLVPLPIDMSHLQTSPQTPKKLYAKLQDHT